MTNRVNRDTNRNVQRSRSSKHILIRSCQDTVACYGTYYAGVMADHSYSVVIIIYKIDIPYSVTKQLLWIKTRRSGMTTISNICVGCCSIDRTSKCTDNIRSINSTNL